VPDTDLEFFMDPKKPDSTGAESARPLLHPPAPIVSSELLQIRERLALAMATAYVANVALKAQEADNDVDVALVLQRLVGDELDRQIERLDAVIAGSAS
jgi:hypothetical protein